MHVNVHDSEDTLLVNHDEQNMRGLGLIIQDIPKRGNLIGVEKVEGYYPEGRAKKSNDVQRGKKKKGKAESEACLTVTEALASKSYEKIAHICDHLLLQAAAEGVAYEDDWPYYSIHLLAHIYVYDINSAWFIWKSIPSAIKESQLEVAIWKIGQKLWMRDYGGVHEAIRGFDWSQEVQCLVAAFSELYTKRMFQLLLSAYSTISIQDTALFLGMNEDDATNYVLQQGWVVDPAPQMLTVKKQTIVTEQKLDATKLQRLIEYVFHLEH